MTVEVAPRLYDQLIAGGRHRMRKPVRMNGRRYAVAVDDRGRAVVGPEIERRSWRWLSRDTAAEGQAAAMQDYVVGADEPLLEERQALTEDIWEETPRMTFDPTPEPSPSPAPRRSLLARLADTEVHRTIRQTALTVGTVAVAGLVVVAVARAVVFLVML